MYTELLHFYVNVKSFLFSLPSFSMFISDLQDLPSPRGADTPTVEQCEDSRWASLALVVAVSFLAEITLDLAVELSEPVHKKRNWKRKRNPIEPVATTFSPVLAQFPLI